ncbi:MAG: hypothetical protein R6U57_03795 [Anaerolineales bacterium]
MNVNKSSGYHTDGEGLAEWGGTPILNKAVSEGLQRIHYNRVNP